MTMPFVQWVVLPVKVSSLKSLLSQHNVTKLGAVILEGATEHLDRVHYRVVGELLGTIEVAG